MPGVHYSPVEAPAGLEPATYGLQIRRSTNCSYGAACFVLDDGGRVIAQGFPSVPGRQKKKGEVIPAMQGGDGGTGRT